MSTQQQAMVMDTILALRKAVKRKAYESDSDSDIERNTNRGYKLKRRARFVRKGQLSAQATGHVTYKETAEHAGFQRTIINKNPPLVDEEGYEVDSDDNEERIHEAMARQAEENPYADVHIAQLMAPLTSVTALPTHPTLSRPFTSKAMTELASQACDLMHKENAALWKVKPLLTKFHGDSDWSPCGVFTEPNDHELFTDTMGFLTRTLQPSISNGVSSPMTNGISHPNAIEAGPSQGANGKGKALGSASLAIESNGHQSNESDQGKGKGKEMVNGDNAPEQPSSSENQNGKAETGEGNQPDGEQPESANKEEKKEHTVNGKEILRITAPDGDGDGDVEMASSETVERTQVSSSRPAYATDQDNSRALALFSDAMDDMFIHPMFLAPRSAHPDRNLGLPDNDAEEMRRLVLLYIQKQEEVCRGAKRLHEGLLKADRSRKTVLQWAKAEAHCGPNRDLSDGEDWIDKEEWGLTEDLKKGQDEEEEDTQATQQKKTRNRR